MNNTEPKETPARMCVVCGVAHWHIICHGCDTERTYPTLTAIKAAGWAGSRCAKCLAARIVK